MRSAKSGEMSSRLSVSVVRVMLWSLAGLVSPAVVWTSVVLRGGTELPHWMAGLLMATYPTWIFSWLVMGEKSRVVGLSIFAGTVLANVLLFTGMGVMHETLPIPKPALRSCVVLVAYVTVAIVTTWAGYQIL